MKYRMTIRYFMTVIRYFMIIRFFMDHERLINHSKIDGMKHPKLDAWFKVNKLSKIGCLVQG